MAFEFNGLYWHSELFKEKKYHLNKTNECTNAGIQLIHIWEDDWDNKTDIVKSFILNKLNKSEIIYARKTQIKIINDNKLIRKFLSENHLQGFVGSSVKIGLFYENELVSMMTFGKLRKSLDQNSILNHYELLRFCNKKYKSVVGGASKLMKYFIDNYNPHQIISYSDNTRSHGNMYKKLGFTLKHISPINYYWVINGVRVHRYNCRKDKLVKMGHNPNRTEREILSDLGYFRIFDAGAKKWIYNIK